MSKELLKAIYEMNETHYEPLRTTERDKVIKLVEQELSKLDEIKEVVSRSRVEEITSSVDTGFNVYHSSDKYYVIRKSTIDKILEEKWWKKKKR